MIRAALLGDDGDWMWEINAGMHPLTATEEGGKEVWEKLGKREG